MKLSKIMSLMLAAVLMLSICTVMASAEDIQTAVQQANQIAAQTATFNPTAFQTGVLYNQSTDANGQTVFTLKDEPIGVWTDNDVNTLEVYPRIVGGNDNPYVFQLAACYSGGPIGAQTLTIYTSSHAFTFTPTATVSLVNNVATELITVNLATEQTLQLIKDLAQDTGSVTYVLYGTTRTVTGSLVLLGQNAMLQMYTDYINANGLKQDLTAAAAVNLSSVYDITYVVENNQKKKTTTQSYNNNYPYYYYYSGYDVDTWAANNLSSSEYLAYLYACGVVTSDDIESWYNSGYLTKEDCKAINGYLGYNAFADSSLDGNYDGQTAAGVAYQDKMYQEWLKSQNSDEGRGDLIDEQYSAYYYSNDNHDGQNAQDVAMIDQAYNDYIASQSGQTAEDVAMIDAAYNQWLASQSSEEGRGDVIDDEYSAYYYPEDDGQTEEDEDEIEKAYRKWLETHPEGYEDYDYDDGYGFDVF